MSTKIIKNTRVLGRANVDGLSFPESVITSILKEMFFDVQVRASLLDAVTTGPAVVKIIVEQEVITHD